MIVGSTCGSNNKENKIAAKVFKHARGTASQLLGFKKHEQMVLYVRILYIGNLFHIRQKPSRRVEFIDIFGRVFAEFLPEQLVREIKHDYYYRITTEYKEPGNFKGLVYTVIKNTDWITATEISLSSAHKLSTANIVLLSTAQQSKKAYSLMNVFTMDFKFKWCVPGLVDQSITAVFATSNSAREEVVSLLNENSLDDWPDGTFVRLHDDMHWDTLNDLDDHFAKNEHSLEHWLLCRRRVFCPLANVYGDLKWSIYNGTPFKDNRPEIITHLGSGITFSSKK